MDAESLTFMPNGDITLKLVRRHGESEQKNRQEIPREEPEGAAQEDGEEEGAEDVLFFAPDPPETEHTANIFYPPVRGRRDSGASSVRDRSTSPPPGFWERLKKDPVVILPEDQDVECVVSSGHMMLASTYFQKRLSGQYIDAVILRKEGMVEMTLSDDPDTLIILLNIIHGRTRKVPRQVSLELLRKLAVLVNYYGMLESVELFSDMWIENLKREGMPSEYNDHVLPWLFIFWVFEKGEDFRSMASMVQRECDEKLSELVGTIPLPGSLIEAINTGRQVAISSAISAIDCLIGQYMDDKIMCDEVLDEDQQYACDALVLGSLLKGARSIGIWPKPAAPYQGQRLGNLLRKISCLRILNIHNNASYGFQSITSSSWNSHGIEDSIREALENIERGLGDLELGDFKKNSETLWEEFQVYTPPPAVKEAEAASHIHPKEPEKDPSNRYSSPQRRPAVLEGVSPPEIASKSHNSQHFRREGHQANAKASALERQIVIEPEKSPRHSMYAIPRKDVRSKSFEEESDHQVERNVPVWQSSSPRMTLIDPPPSYQALEKEKEVSQVSSVFHVPVTQPQIPREVAIPPARNPVFEKRQEVSKATNVPNTSQDPPRQPQLLKDVVHHPPATASQTQQKKKQDLQQAPSTTNAPQEAPRQSQHLKGIANNQPPNQLLEKKKEIKEVPSASQRREPMRETSSQPPVNVQQDINRSADSLQKVQNWRDAQLDAPRRRSTLEELKDNSTLDQARQSPPRPLESPRRNPLFEGVKEVKESYSFEEDIGDLPVEGAKVNDNWRDSLVGDGQAHMEDVKASLSNNEDNDLFIPPTTFKVRKSKKRFTTRF